MIGTLDIEIHAANPGVPLRPLVAYVSSPSQVRLVNVPRTVGQWSLTRVYVEVTYPDNAVHAVTATRAGALWSATLPACAVTGTVQGGLTVCADGVDESGTEVTGYVIGRGDVEILSADGKVIIEGASYTVSAGQILKETEEEGVYELVSLAEANAVIANYNAQKIGALPASHTIADLESALKGE